MKNKLSLYILTCLLSASCFAQFSKTHYIPPVGESNSVSVDAQLIYLSTPSLTPVSFTINQIGSTIVSGVLSRNAPYIFDINSNTANQFVMPTSEMAMIRSDRGYIIEASDLIYATVRCYDQNNANQAGQITSKGLAALGKEFRIGGFLNQLTTNFSSAHLTFASILATENNTTVTFSNIQPGVDLINNTAAGNTPAPIVLNAGQSYILAVDGSGGVAANRDGLIGALISSDKPIAVNCGSWAGSNGEMGNIDIGMDQVVPADKIGSDYIFVKGLSTMANTERILLIAHQNNTNIYLSGSSTPNYTLNAGQYVALVGTDYTAAGNLFVHADKNIFAYQSVGDNSQPGYTNNQADQEMYFVPPLSCQTPKGIDNIPFIDKIGAKTFTGRITIVTKTGSTLNFGILNGTTYTTYTYATLPSSIAKVGPTAIAGNSSYESYTLNGLSGSMSIFSTSELYVAALGSSGAAAFGGYYSGFTFKPEITFQPIAGGASTNCIPNVDLKVSTLTSFDQFQWYFNTVPSYIGATTIAGATNANYIPTATTASPSGYGPGYYFVNATMSFCGGFSKDSDIIPVSECPINADNDLANDNVDLDLDNDGLSNCTESLGNLPIDLTNLSAGNFSITPFSNSFTGTTATAGPGLPLGTVTGNSNGNIITEVPAGKDSEVSYKINFTNPVSVAIQYVAAAGTLATDLINDKASYIIKSPVNTTVSVLNPTNQLLIDTNYDGIYESGVTQFSSFEIRFRVNSATPLAAGTGTFSFRSHLTTSLEITHKNQLDTAPNRSTFNFIATCIPNDYDADIVPDQLDMDADNDGIVDNKEFMSQNYITPSGLDANKNGMDDAYDAAVILASDKDGDGVKDYLDLDSDNDGIYDLVESGSTAVDVNLDGIIDGNPASFGTNGLSNSVETTADSGITNYTIRNTDGLVFDDYIDSDADEDLCSDVVEAGFLDPNNDFYLGNSPLTVNAKGVVTSAVGYTAPNADYITAAPISISTQPVNISTCELQGTAIFTVVSTAVTGYQWQVSTNGGTSFSNLANTATYSNVTTATLSVANPTAAMSGYKYRVYLSKTGNTCGLYSTAAILTTWALPNLTPITTLKQCDDDTDGISVINLTQKNSFISPNSAVESFTFFTTLADAQGNINPIANPTAYTSATATFWVRVVNANLCYKICQLDVIVSATAINSTIYQRTFTICDDYLNATNNDYDGISVFDFSPADAQIKALLPPPISNYTVKYYANLADAQSEINAIVNTTSYRNVIVNQQDIYVRIDSNADNACFGMDKLIKLVVEKLPVFNTVGTNNLIRQCDDNNDGLLTLDFNTSLLETQILNGQVAANKVFTYFDAVTNAALPSPLPNPFTVVGTRSVKVHIANTLASSQASNKPCNTEQIITFLVDVLPQNFANTISTVLTSMCDDEADPLQQNGLLSFDTSTFDATALGTQTGMVLSYTYKDSTGATITTPSLPNPFVTGTQIVTVKVTNPLNPTCPAVYLLKLEVKPIPKINLIGNEEVVCTNIPSLFVTLTGGIVDGTSPLAYTYIWKFNNGSTTVTLPQTTPTIAVNMAGIYTVTVSSFAGCSATRTIKVYASDIAHIQNINIIDLTDINSVEVVVTGTGTYEYALDDPSKYQTSNFFDNVSIGFHTVYIQDVYKLPGCGWIKKDISVVGAPRFFTPNGDGINDFWNLKGVNKQFNYKSVIFIYNRFGTLVKEILPGTPGWDGTFDGNPALSDDYWFVVELADGRSAKGHFSLKR
jgi:gliding motility-associated-like protein